MAKPKKTDTAAQIAPEAQAAPPAVSAPASTHALVAHALIVPDLLNPRKTFDEDGIQELADSIAEKGLIQNLLVRPAAPMDGFAQPVHRLVAGERRWRAMALLIKQGLLPPEHQVQVEIRDMTEEQHAVLALIENMVRRDLKPMEEARAFQRLAQDYGLSTTDIARSINVTPRLIQQRLQFLQLKPADAEALEAGKITVEEARNRLAAYPKPLSLEFRLTLVEILDKAATDPIDSGYYKSVEVRAATIREETESHTNVRVKIEDKLVKDLLRAQVVQIPERIHLEGVETGRHKLPLGYSLDFYLRQIWPDGASMVGDKAKRAKLLQELRSEKLGEEAAAALPPGRYVTPWLNGPFPMTAEVEAEIQRQREAREAREAAYKAEQNKQAAITKAANKAKRTAAEQLTGAIGAVRLDQLRPLDPRLPELAAGIEAPLPWFVTPKGELIAAGGQMILAHYYGDLAPEDLARRRLIAAAVNAAAGLVTPAEDPSKPRDLPLDAYLDVVAVHLLQQDPEFAGREEAGEAIMAEAKAKALRAVNFQLVKTGRTFGEPAGQWSEVNAQRFAASVAEGRVALEGTPLEAAIESAATESSSSAPAAELDEVAA